jgi:hypothetical protein
MMIIGSMEFPVKDADYTREVCFRVLVLLHPPGQDHAFPDPVLALAVRHSICSRLRDADVVA